MKRTLIALAAVAVAALVSVSLATGKGQAKTVKLSAVLNVAQETDHPKGTKAGASGTFSATITGTKLKWTLTWKNLTGKATQAHVHVGKRGVSGNVLVPLCPPGCTSPNHGSWTLTKANVKLIEGGGTYVNVHTTKNNLGEIRGQLTKVT